MKIRNINVQGNAFSYAGPVGHGRGSRKSPEAFSGASPPALLNSILSAILTGLLALSCAQPGGNGPGHTHDFSGAWQWDDAEHWKICQEDNTIGQTAPHVMEGWTVVNPATETATGLEVNDCGVCDYQKQQVIPATYKYQTLASKITVNDVKTSRVLDISGQGNISNNMANTIKPGLTAQSNQMIGLQGPLADSIRSAEVYMNNIFSNSGDAGSYFNAIMLGGSTGGYKSLINELCALSSNPDAYRAQIEAYRSAKCLKQSYLLGYDFDTQKDVDVSDPVKDAQASALVQSSQGLLGGTPMPDGPALEALIKALEDRLVRDMQANGQDRNTGFNILQQLGDFAEFEGWYDAVVEKGLQVHTSINIKPNVSTGNEKR